MCSPRRPQQLFSWAEVEAEAADPANHIAFTPAPRRRARRKQLVADLNSTF